MNVEKRKVLSVDPNSWHYRLYRYHRFWVNRFLELGGDQPKEPRLDLCRYMRALLIWIPLTAILVAVIALLAPIWWPLTREGVREMVVRFARRLDGWLHTKLALGLLILLSVASVIAIISTISIKVYQDPGHAAHETGRVAWISAVSIMASIALVVGVAVVCTRWGDFLKLVWAWIVAKKHRICPLLAVLSVEPTGDTEGR